MNKLSIVSKAHYCVVLATSYHQTKRVMWSRQLRILGFQVVWYNAISGQELNS